MFRMSNKRALLVEVWCTSINLSFHSFQNNFATLGPKMGFIPPEKISLGGPAHSTTKRREINRNGQLSIINDYLSELVSHRPFRQCCILLVEWDLL